MKYVTFEIAKLLKEKGFNDGADYWYSVEGSLYHVNEFNNCSGYIPDHSCDAPTRSDVVDWIYEKHGIWIEVSRDYANGKYIYQYFIDTHNQEFGFNTPQEAYLTGIKYTLNNLI